MKKLHFIILLLSLLVFANAAHSQDRWALLLDMNEDWLYYEDEWLPLTNRLEKHDAIHFRMPDVQGNNHLMVKHPGEFSIFFNNKIFYTADDSLLINVDSLMLANGFQNALVTIYGPDLQPNFLRTHLLFRYTPGDEPEPSNVINIIKRKTDASDDFAILALLIILFLTVLLKIFYSRNFLIFYDVKKTFSSRDVEEDFLRGRLFSQINVLIMLYQCLIVGLFISLLVIYINIPTGEEYKSIAGYMALWFKSSGYVALFLFLKFILINNFTSLYSLSPFTTSHYMSYFRIITLAFFSGTLLLYIGIYSLGWDQPESFNFGINFVLFLLALGILLIYLKLINSVSYKKLHLFSYLCATEILPYVVVLKVAINQSI